MYSKIYNPKTNRNVSIYSLLGKKILKSYLQELGITGGAEPEPDTLFGSILNKKIGLNHKATARALTLHNFRIGDRVQLSNLPNNPVGFIIAEPQAGWLTVRLDGHDDFNQVWHRNLINVTQPRGERARNVFHGPGAIAPPAPYPEVQRLPINIGDRVQIRADGEMADVYGIVNNIYRVFGDRMNTIVIMPDGYDEVVHIYEDFVVPTPHRRHMYGGPGAIDPRS